MIGEGIVGLQADQVDRVVGDVDQAYAVVLDRFLGEAEHQRDIHVAVLEHLQRLDRVPVDEAQLDPRMRDRKRGGGCRHDRAQRGRVRGEPDMPRLQTDVRRQLGGGRVDAPHDLRCAAGEQLTLGRQPDPAPDPLDEPGAGGCLQPGQVVAHRWLGVVQLAGRLGHRAGAGDGGEDAEVDKVQHTSILSMSQALFWHWTSCKIRRTLKSCQPPANGPPSSSPRSSSSRSPDRACSSCSVGLSPCRCARRSCPWSATPSACSPRPSSWPSAWAPWSPPAPRRTPSSS